MKLVTGATGLVGSHLIMHLLDRNPDEKIVALYRKNSKIESVKKIFGFYGKDSQALFDRIEWRRADILNYQEILDVFDSVDEVYHCAAIVAFSKKEKNRVIENNVRGTANMVNAALENNVKKFVYTSSVAAIGSNDGGIITEETQAIPEEKISVYSKSKFYAELEVWRGHEEGLNVVIVNPSIIFGIPTDWDSKLIGKLFWLIWKGFRFYSNGVMGYVDVNDVAKAMIMLAEREIYGERFIVNSENLSYKQVFDMIADALGKPRPNMYAYDFLLTTAFYLDQIKSFLTPNDPVLTKEIVKYAKQQDYYSSEKLLKALPDFKFTPIKETIDFMAKFFLAHVRKEEKSVLELV